MYSKYSIPLIAAGLVFTARTDDTTSKQEATGGPAGTERQTDASRQQQDRLSEQQRNQQSTFRPGQISEGQLRKQVTEVNKASSFIGMSVKNTQNEDLGKIHDLVFDPQNGRISYAVLSIGGVLGVGDKLIAVPVTSLKPQPGQNYLTINMDKNQVNSAPGLAQQNWPDLNWQGYGGAAGSETGTIESDATGAPGSTTTEQRSFETTTPTPQDSSTDQQATPDQSRTPGAQGSSATSETGTSSSATGTSPGSSTSSSSIGSNSDASQSSSTSTDPERDSRSSEDQP